MITGVDTLRNHLEKLNCFAISEENRNQLQQALASLSDALTALVSANGNDPKSHLS